MPFLTETGARKHILNSQRFPFAAPCFQAAYITSKWASAQKTIPDRLPAGGVIVARDLYIFMHYYDATYYPPIPTKIRDQRIRARHAEGDSLSELARIYGISPQRIYQIINPAK
jgi:hypothetical protein